MRGCFSPRSQISKGFPGDLSGAMRLLWIFQCLKNRTYFCISEKGIELLTFCFNTRRDSKDVQEWLGEAKALGGTLLKGIYRSLRCPSAYSPLTCLSSGPYTYPVCIRTKSNILNDILTFTDFLTHWRMIPRNVDESRHRCNGRRNMLLLRILLHGVFQHIPRCAILYGM